MRAKNDQQNCERGKMKKLALICILILAFVYAWGLLPGSVPCIFGGAVVEGPLNLVVGAWHLIITVVVLFCVGVLLAFILAGVGLVVLGSFALTLFVLVAVLFPFLLPLLIPLFIIWAFCAAARGKSRS